MDNAYSPAKFRPACKTFSSVQLKYNASHMCNLKFSSSYIFKSRKKQVELIWYILFNWICQTHFCFNV